MDKPQFRYFRDSALGHFYNELYVKCDTASKECFDVHFDKTEKKSLYNLNWCLRIVNNPRNNTFVEILPSQLAEYILSVDNNTTIMTESNCQEIKCACCELPIGFHYNMDIVLNLKIFCPVCMELMQKLKTVITKTQPDLDLNVLSKKLNQAQEHRMLNYQIITQLLNNSGIYHQKFINFIDGKLTLDK